MIYYFIEIFKIVGLSVYWVEYVIIVIGGVNVVMIFVFVFIMDKVGRRFFLLIGVGGLFIFSVVLVVFLIFIKVRICFYLFFVIL